MKYEGVRESEKEEREGGGERERGERGILWFVCAGWFRHLSCIRGASQFHSELPNFALNLNVSPKFSLWGQVSHDFGQISPNPSLFAPKGWPKQTLLPGFANFAIAKSFAPAKKNLAIADLTKKNFGHGKQILRRFFCWLDPESTRARSAT